MRRRSSAATLVALTFALGCGVAGAQSPRLYKWVDEHGNVHYSDRMEASASSEDVHRISSNGIRIGTPHSALPQNDVEKREQQEARRQAQLDTMLLSTYRTELDLLRAHDQSRAPIENGLRSAEKNIERLEQALSLRRNRTAALPVADRNTPVDSSIDDLRQQIANEQANLEMLRKRRYELYERQNMEVARYRELTSSATAGSQQPTGANPRIVPGGV